MLRAYILQGWVAVKLFTRDFVTKLIIAFGKQQANVTVVVTREI